MSCDDCPLNGSVKVEYKDGVDRSILIIGESPGATEVIEGVPFVGPSGRLLEKCMAIAGLDKSKYYIANSAKCRMDRNFKKSSSMVRKVCNACKEYLDAYIKEVNPKIILLLGGIALKQVTKKTKLMAEHGTISRLPIYDCWYMPTLHPSYCIQFPQYESVLQEDIIKMAQFINSGYRMNKGDIEIRSISSIEEAEGIEDAEYIAIDSETQGADPTDPNGLVISFSFAFSDNVGYQVLLHQEVDVDSNDYDFSIRWDRKVGKAKTRLNLKIKKAEQFDNKIALLRYILESDKKKIMFNGNFDIRFFDQLFLRNGLEKPRIKNYIMDVQAASHLLEENIYTRCSLEQSRKGFTDLTSDYSTSFDSRYDKSDMLSVPPDELGYYAAMDAVTTYRCGMAIRDRMNKGEVYLNPFSDYQEGKWYRPKEYCLSRYFLRFVMPTLEALRVLEDNGAR
ncbi:MAG: uracil-DNA glycosylase family protein, partial [bacterium]